MGALYKLPSLSNQEKSNFASILFLPSSDFLLLMLILCDPFLISQGNKFKTLPVPKYIWFLVLSCFSCNSLTYILYIPSDENIFSTSWNLEKGIYLKS